MKAEYVATSMVTYDLLELYKLLGEIKVRVTKTILLQVCNQAAIKQIQDKNSGIKAKHIAVRLKIIKNYSKKS